MRGATTEFSPLPTQSRSHPPYGRNFASLDAEVVLRSSDRGGRNRWVGRGERVVSMCWHRAEPETRAVLERLADRVSGIALRWGVRVVIEEIAARRDPVVLPYLAPLAIGRGAVSRRVAEVIEDLLPLLSCEDQSGLDQAVRWGWQDPLRIGYGVRSAPLDVVSSIERAPQSVATGALVLAASDYDGRVRMAAVNALARRDGPGVLPILLVRANDWYAPIAERAAGILRERLASDGAASFVGVLPLVMRLESCARVDHRPFLDTLHAALSAPEEREALLGGLEQGTAGARRACHEQIVRHDGSWWLDVSMGLLGDRDPVLRLAAGRHLLRGTPDHRLGPILEELAASRIPRLRYEALGRWIALDESGVVPALHGALTDRNGGVRSLAAFHLRRITGEDLARTYRELVGLCEDRERIGAVLGLGEHGERADAARLVALAGSGNTRLDQAIVRAVGSLDARGQQVFLHESLAHDSPRVVREASRACVLQRVPLEDEELGRLLRTDPRPHVRREAVRLLARPFRLDRAVHLVVAASDASEVVRGTAIALLNDALGRYTGVAILPRREVLDRLAEALASAGEAVPGHLRGALQAIIAECIRRRGPA